MKRFFIFFYVSIKGERGHINIESAFGKFPKADRVYEILKESNGTTCVITGFNELSEEDYKSWRGI